MPKAMTIDRIAWTRQKMEAREAQKQGHGLKIEVTPENLGEVQARILADEEAKKNSPFLKMREEMRREHPEDYQDLNTCPTCGGMLERWEGCWRCKNCGVSLC